MRFQRPGSGIVEFTPAAVESMLAHRQLRLGDREAGGILLGRRINGTADVVVDEASRPATADRASRFRFFRARRPAQERVIAAWQSSAATRNYLGDWHTHPEDTPTPSCIDRKNWNRIVRRARFEQPFLFFVIVGRRDTAVWEASRPHGGVQQLTPLAP